MGNLDDASKLNPIQRQNSKKMKVQRQNSKKMKDKKFGGSAMKEKVSIFKKCADAVDHVLKYE